MKRKNVFFKAGILLLSLFLLPGMLGCGAISNLMATPTPTPVPGIQTPISIGNIQFRISEARMQQEFNVGERPIEPVLSEHFAANGGFFSEGNLLRPSSPSEVFLVIRAEATPSDCEQILSWVIGVDELGNANDLSGYLAMCWSIDASTPNAPEMRVVWAFVVPSTLDSFFLHFPGNNSVDLEGIIDRHP